MTRLSILLFLTLAACGAQADDDEFVKINKKYWVCTSTHTWHHEARRGMLTRFGRMSDTPAYDSTECDQWSAVFDQGCVSTNAWCVAQSKEKGHD